MKRAFILASALIAAHPTMADALSPWDSQVEVFGGYGWRDNVLRTGMTQENSGFLYTTVDASLMRFSENNAYWLVYFLADDIRYFDAPSVNYEQFLSVTAEYVSPVGARDEWGLLANYLYQHQIVDASATEQDLRRVLVLGHALSLAPHWKRLFSKGWAFRLEGVVLGQVFEQDLDDYLEAGAVARVSKTYGNRSELAAAWETLVRAYDTRQQVDVEGFEVPGTKLQYFQNEGSGAWRHSWDAARRWRTMTQVRYLLSVDNGSGYFNYDRLLFRQRLQWRPDHWNWEGNARIGAYHHPNQAVGDDRRWRSYAVVDARVERDVWKVLKAYAAAEYEWSFSNDPRDEYESWMVSVGLGMGI